MSKVLFLNTYGNGSTGNIVNSLKKICKDDGIEAISLYSREYCATPETSQRFFNKLGFYIDGLMTRVFDNHGCNSHLNTYRIIKQIKTEKPNIIHIHNLHGYWINYKMLFKYLSKTNIKVIWTLHDCWSFTGHCTHFDYVKCDKWKTGCYKCPQLLEYPSSKVFDGSKRNYKSKKHYFNLVDKMIIVTPSEWLASKARLSILKDNDIRVINNGINLDVFHHIDSNYREKYKLNNNPIILAVSSYWNERKGLKYILDVAKKREDLNFVIIGQIVNNENDLKLSNVLFIDRTENVNELVKWYSLADIYINPTLEDTYPTTNLEAIACETPVVTFKTGGSVEIVQQTGCGLVVKENNSKGIIDGIDTILNNRISKSKFESAKEKIDSLAKFNEYLKLYKEI